MLSRQQRRKIDKKMKKELTKDQFKDLKNEAVYEMAHHQAGQMFKDFSMVLIEKMRENRISEQRVKKILDETFQVLKEKKV